MTEPVIWFVVHGNAGSFDYFRSKCEENPQIDAKCIRGKLIPLYIAELSARNVIESYLGLYSCPKKYSTFK